jgi:hypothetical protein
MGIWIEILQLGGAGKSDLAKRRLGFDLPLSLRDFVPSSEGTRQYRGVIPRAVRRLTASLSAGDRSLLQSCEADFVDYILADVCEEVERTLILVELCHHQPYFTLEQLQELFPWALGLKRSDAWKRLRLLGYLVSFRAVGVDLPAELCRTLDRIDDPNIPNFPFDEIAYAVSSTRMEQSWKDFKEAMEWSDRFVGIITEEEGGRAAEFLDYGSVASAHWLLNPKDESAENKLEWHLLAQEIRPDLLKIINDLQATNSTAGYPPIAWHNVFWTLSSDYESLPLTLEIHDPYQETDQELADYLKSHYPEIEGTSRPVISRRRKKLYDACTARIIGRLREHFMSSEKKIGVK